MSKPIKIYADNPDPAAMSQFYDAMKQDSAVQGAIMPDVHKGYTLPIGAVVATDSMIFPSWCGYDLGCGCNAVPTTFERAEVEQHRDVIFKRIYEAIPTGVGKHNTSSVEWEDKPECTEMLTKLWKARNGQAQIGTLGAGNHFMEIGYDEEDRVWMIIHSGSRGIGHGTATHYMKLASGSRKAKEWHFGLKTDSQEGQDYIADLNFCLQFALKNRLEMMTRLSKVLKKYCSGKVNLKDDPLWINRNHNHAELKDGLWIHRKGATHAEKDMLGVIPGNMRDGSFIVKGKGNPESLCSSAHGAGRTKSRSQAKKDITLTTLKEQMEGITAKVESNVLDEAPDAYKDIFEVMRLQEDLVEVLHRVKPIINIKA